MIHKINALFDQGRGLSIRAISRELGISRNTVRKYLTLDAATISQAREDPSRRKCLDEHRDFLIHQLKAFPQLSAVKLARRLREKVGSISVSDRSLRRYVRALKEQVASGQCRYYEPVLDAVPGVQCQVDPGELRDVLIGGQVCAVYFVVFVLACSRLMYVGVRFRPLDTDAFIQLHDEAFRYFGGLPEECVYDQTKLVVIREQYRELTLNQRFHQYATTAGYRIHACEGYDPESKGKVEAGVKYVKQNALYGETFESEGALRQHIMVWLDTVANARTHGTTGRQPRVHFDSEERAHLRPYAVPQSVLHRVADPLTRSVDKTGLISWKGNKYSVPMAWQRAQVGVHEREGSLHIHDLESGDGIASHTLCQEKGRTLKNSHHYRDPSQRIVELEAAIALCLPPGEGEILCRLLKTTSPKIYKDQLVGVRDLLQRYGSIDAALREILLQQTQLTASAVQRYLEAWQQARRRGREPDDMDQPSAENQMPPCALMAYARLGRPAGQEVSHESA